MWPLIRDFFTLKSSAVRAFRVAAIAAGIVAVNGIPNNTQDWVISVLTALSGAVTQQPK